MIRVASRDHSTKTNPAQFAQLLDTTIYPDKILDLIIEWCWTSASNAAQDARRILNEAGASVEERDRILVDKEIKAVLRKIRETVHSDITIGLATNVRPGAFGDVARLLEVRVLSRAEKRLSGSK